ncbi:Metallo-hydrolase/oxidoreductase [Patellaria atrata CBS 101060]|uniref:Metallo-hydrolase/oxidoreductase n=1 Tax=Patellaria atrata CBS 101060 TaxID=1346257 RepID=A0A9P4SJG1_9PEZI|nr:Metallo-hydrolase/oxidoreductase [Patellaria atrata CBS 101060]
MASASTAAVLYASVVSSAQLTGAVPEDAKELKHHAKGGKGFINPWESYTDLPVFKTLCTMLYRRFVSRTTNIPDTTPPTVPVHKPDFLPTRETPTLRATWLGHACYYVEFPSGFRALFDPVFEQRCSPFTWLGPSRYTPMPCEIEDLPFIDAVIISHNHYDHLSHPTVTTIKKRFPNVHFFVPLGNKKWFEKCELHNVTELDWWETRDITLSAVPGKSESSPSTTVSTEGKTPSTHDNILATINCLPCQHTSARTPFDRAHTLWASWSISSGGKSIWFGGDTGYRKVPQLPPGENDYDVKYSHFPFCPAFKQIGELRGPFDLGLIPIGAYDPRFIMSSMHANPFDSVNIFIDTKCKKALGMHWGTWVLTEEDVMEPPKLLREAMKWKELPEEGVFDVVDIGESLEVK